MRRLEHTGVFYTDGTGGVSPIDVTKSSAALKTYPFPAVDYPKGTKSEQNKVTYQQQFETGHQSAPTAAIKRASSSN